MPQDTIPRLSVAFADADRPLATEEPPQTLKNDAKEAMVYLEFLVAVAKESKSALFF
eukprot:CAMPEP_0173094046 /NCGR_PEP_ID=MMETSP1102-20130122/30582_1 /TAXON_ID=49646 /ORGANISM="Geminigera sp., Strain Caron Lab Isolate" /LENGTH=56 /DNA_ID=CAMNT_0013982637 /DNA_START=584 /DNA_END=751 /DNA_ORIENTATION=+